MKPISSHRSSTVKSRGVVVDRKSTTVSRKRLRRLRPPIEDDEEEEEDEEEEQEEEEDEEEDEVEEVELSPGTSSSIAPPSRRGGRIPRKRGRTVVVGGDGDLQDEDEEIDGGREIEDDDDVLLMIDFAGGGGSSSSSASDLLATISTRDFDQNPLHSDELDQLQSAMEKSLTDSILRKRNVRAALKQLATTTNSKRAGTPTTTRACSAASASSTRAIGKRKLPHQTTTGGSVLSKRPAVSSTTISSSSPPAKRNRGAGNKRSFRPTDTTRSSSSPIGRPCSRVYYYAQHNHQMPDKFWSFVDQYAGAIESDTLNLLEKLVEDSDPNTPESAQYYQLPDVVPPTTTSRRPSSSMSSSDASRRGHTNKSSGGRRFSSPPPPNKSATKAKAKTKINKASANVVNNKKSAAMKKRAGGGVSNSSRSVDDDHSAGEDDASSSNTTTRLSAQKKPLPTTATTAKTRTPRKNAVKDPKPPNTIDPIGANSGSSEKNGLSTASPLGPLTERLVQALLDDYVVTTTTSSSNGGGEDDQQTDAKTGSNNKVLMKTLNLGNLKSLETRIKNELIDQGILEPEDDLLLPSGDSSDADEVTAELKRSQRELAVLQRSNHQRLAALAAQAKASHRWVGREAALREANDQVLHLCSRYYGTAPASRKPEGRAERDALWTALKEREKAAAQLPSS